MTDLTCGPDVGWSPCPPSTAQTGGVSPLHVLFHFYLQMKPVHVHTALTDASMSSAKRLAIANMCTYTCITLLLLTGFSHFLGLHCQDWTVFHRGKTQTQGICRSESCFRPRTPRGPMLACLAASPGNSLPAWLAWTMKEMDSLSTWALKDASTVYCITRNRISQERRPFRSPSCNTICQYWNE